MKRAILAGAALFGAALPAHAIDLSSPFSLETTKVLPPNVRNPRFIDVFTSIDEKYGGSGALEPLGQPLFQAVTWKKTLDVQENDAKRSQILGIIRDPRNGVDPNGPGMTTGDVHTFANIKVPVLAAGITERFTLAAAIPIVRIDVTADTGFIAGPGASQFRAAAARTNPTLGEEATRKMNDSVNVKLASVGMEPIHSFTVSGVGDLQLVGKYLAYDDHVTSWAVKGTCILPTGTPPNPDKALDVPTGDGRLGLGAQAVHNYNLAWDFALMSQASYTAFVPRSIVKRLPTASDDPISADKENVHENLRSLYQLGTGVQKTFPRAGLSLGVGYDLQYLSPTSYDVGQYAPERYGWLQDLQPSETLHSYLVSATFSTVDWYQKKQFFYPMEARLAYSHPIWGHNATRNDLIAGELVVFF